MILIPLQPDGKGDSLQVLDKGGGGVLPDPFELGAALGFGIGLACGFGAALATGSVLEVSCPNGHHHPTMQVQRTLGAVHHLASVDPSIPEDDYKRTDLVQSGYTK